MKSLQMRHPRTGKTVSRCHVAVSSHRTIKLRQQCDQPAMKGIVLCRRHNRTGGRSAFVNGAFVGGTVRKRT